MQPHYPLKIPQDAHNALRHRGWPSYASLHLDGPSQALGDVSAKGWGQLIKIVMIPHPDSLVTLSQLSFYVPPLIQDGLRVIISSQHVAILTARDNHKDGKKHLHISGSDCSPIYAGRNTDWEDVIYRRCTVPAVDAPRCIGELATVKMGHGFERHSSALAVFGHAGPFRWHGHGVVS